jgi:signal transduction histidine kinase
LRTRLFNRFEQGNVAPLRGSRGSGIGLSLVKELTELHGGTVTVADVPSGGSAFTITLPKRPTVRSVAPVPALTAAARDERVVLPHDLGLTQLAEAEIVQPQHTVEATILVAEDQPQLRTELGRLLGEHYRVILAPDGQRALELVRRHLPDLIVTDIQMPRMNGFQLIDAVHELKEIRVPAVIMLTTFDSLGNRVKGFEGGALDCVAKPFEPAELLARIRTQLQNRKRAARTAEIERLASLGTTIKGFMHELRNPVNAIVHLLELMPSMMPEGERHKGNQLYDFIALAAEAAEHLREMSNDLLGADTRGELRLKPVALAPVVRRARALLPPDVAKVRFVETPGFDGLASLSERMMAQVLANLFTNAGQAAGGSGWIGFTSRASDGRLILEISDSGPGVPAHLRERIFDLYFTTKDPGAGTGLGLYISRRIVEQHGGTLTAQDGAHGTVFVIDLPLDGAAPIALDAAADSH